MAKYLLCADVHLGRPSAGHGPEQITEAAWLRLCAKATDLGVDAIIVAGDLVDAGLHIPRAAEALRRGFDRLDGIPVRTVRGNHDHAVLPALAKTFGDRLKAIDCARLGWGEDSVGGLELVGWGFSAASHAGCCFDDAPIGDARHRLGVLHADVGSRGGSYNGVTKTDLEESPLAGFWVVGHIHKPSEGANWFYPGSLQPMDIGETGERSVTVLDWSPGSGFGARTHHRIADVRYEVVRPDLTGASHRDEALARIEAALAFARENGATRIRVRPQGRYDLSPADRDALGRALESVSEFERLLTDDLRPAWDLDAWALANDSRGLLSRVYLRATEDRFRDDAEVDRLWAAALRDAPTVPPVRIPYDEALASPDTLAPISDAARVARAAERLLERVAKGVTA